jgi:hypothetical protein
LADATFFDIVPLGAACRLSPWCKLTDEQHCTYCRGEKKANRDAKGRCKMTNLTRRLSGTCEGHCALRRDLPRQRGELDLLRDQSTFAI